MVGDLGPADDLARVAIDPDLLVDVARCGTVYARDVDDAVADRDVGGRVLRAVLEDDRVDALLVGVDDHVVDDAEGVAVLVERAVAADVLVLGELELPVAGVGKGDA